MNAREPFGGPAGLHGGLARTGRGADGAAASPPDHWPNRALSRRRRAGGLDWHVQRGGVGTKLLLLHGTGASTHSWAGLLPRLAADHDVLAPDLPGHAWTSAPRAPGTAPTLPGMAKAVAALLAAEAFEPEVIVGHSAGAALALQLVLEEHVEPALVIGLNAALAPYGGLLAPLAQPLARLFAALAPVSAVIAARARQPQTVERLIAGTGSRLDETGIARYRELFSREAHVGATLNMMAYWDLAPLQRRLARLPCPLCLIVGDDDRTVPPAQADRSLRQVSRGQVLHLEGLGHLAHEEAPDRVAAAIEAAEAAFGVGDD